MSDRSFKIGNLIFSATKIGDGATWELEIGSHTQQEYLASFIINKEDLDSIPYSGTKLYDPEFGDERLCDCGHAYYRHFDTYEDMRPVGCKYCQCYIWALPGSVTEGDRDYGKDCINDDTWG